MRKLYLIIGVLIVSVYSTLAQAPKVSLSTVSVSETLTAGQTRPISIQLTNTGNRDLQWQMAPASVTFSKANYANYLLPESQDQITDGVWITRANSEGLFNAAKQDDFGNWDAGSPLGTRWAAGYTHNPQTAYREYMDLLCEVSSLSPFTDRGCFMPIYPTDWYHENYEVLSLQLEGSEQYYDIYFTSWTRGDEGGGGGFSYIRYDAYKWLGFSHISDEKLLPGAQTDINLTLDATQMVEGVYHGKLYLSSNDPSQPSVEVALELTVVGEPQINLPSTSVDFGSQPIEGTYTSLVQIENPGTAELVLFSFVSDNAAFSVQETTVSIPALSSYELEVLFSPSAEEVYNGTLTFSTNIPSGGDITLDLAGQGGAKPVLDLQTSSLNITMNSNELQTTFIDISNLGLGELTWKASYQMLGENTITFTKPDYADWTKARYQDRIYPSVIITRQDDRTIYNSALEAASNGSVSPANTLWAYGKSGDVDFANYSDFRNLVNGDPDKLTRESISVYLVATESFFDLTFHSWTQGAQGGGFSYTRELVPVIYRFKEGNLAAGASGQIELDINTSSMLAGVYDIELYLSTNDPSQTQVTIPLTLTVSGSPAIDITNALDFGEIFVNDTKVMEVEIYNFGTDDLTISTIALDNAAFSILEYPTTIAPRETKIMKVQYAPTAVNVTETATLTVTSNMEGSTESVISLSASALEPPTIVVNTTEWAYTVASGNTMVKQLTIQNTGASELRGTLSARNSEGISVSKPAYGNWALSEHQDRISDEVWITRGTSEGIFNFVTETNFTGSVSPEGTVWANVPSFEAGATTTYTNWGNAISWNPPSMVGRTISMYIPATDELFDMDFTQWSENGTGGGFAYTRYKTVKWLKGGADFTQAAASQSDIAVTFDATDLYAGEYSTTLHIRTNDPLNPLVTIPVSLTVTGEPFISVMGMNFGNVPMGGSIVENLRIENAGTDVLTVSGISAPSGAFSYATTGFSIEPGKYYDLPITFSPSALIAYSLDIEITSDASNGSSTLVNLGGVGVDPPVLEIGLGDLPIDDELGTEQNYTYSFVIRNTGASPLNWTLGGEQVEMNKANLADWTLEANQDRITENVWITRKDSQGLFNIAQESAYGGGSPLGTQWAFGGTADLTADAYSNWIDAVNNSPGSMVGQPISLYLPESKRYFDVLFTNYAGGGTAGGFAYTRTEVLPDWISFDQNSGSLAPAEEVTVTITLSTHDLSGDYKTRFGIFTNDPSQNQVVQEVAIHVEDIKVLSTIAEQKLDRGFGTHSIDLSAVFYSVNQTPLSYTVVSSNTNAVTVATVADELILTEVGSGLSVISLRVADGLGNAVYQDFNVLVGVDYQTITFDAIANQLFSDGHLDLTASASSGLEVSYASSDESIATISGNRVSFVGVGTVTITASQAGDENYLPANSVEQLLTINKGNQTITFNPLADKVYGDAAFDLGASVSSNLTITYTSSNPSVATIEGKKVTIVGVGTTSITASQEGNALYNPAANVSRNLVVNKATQSITSFDAIPTKTYGDAAFTLQAASSANLTVSFTSSDENVISISGTQATVVGAGSAIITATQAGNENYLAAANMEQTVTVNKAAQTIDFAVLTVRTYGDAAFDLPSTSSAGLSISYTSSNEAVASISGHTLTIHGAGNATITATQSGNTNYMAAANVARMLTVNKANQTIDFPALTDKTFGDATFELAASTSSGLSLSYSSSDEQVATVRGTTVTIVGAGTVTIMASQSGDANYLAATDVEQSFTVAKASQSITVAPIAQQTIFAGPISVEASSTSGLALDYSVESGPASFSGNVLTLSGEAGTVRLTVSQEGNRNYISASASISFEVIDPCLDFATTEVLITDNLCANESLGSIAVSVTGGTAPYTYLWSTGASTATISELAAGTYTLIITDANTCSIELSATVEAPSALEATATLTENTQPDAANGVIDLSVTGGTAPYTFSWSNGAETEDISGLEAGNYTLTLTDANGCSLTATYEVEEDFISGISHPLADIKIYPNPARDFVQLEGFQSGEKVSIRLVSLHGKRLQEYTVEGKTSFQVPVHKEKAGVYLLQITVGNHTRTQKIQVE